MTKSKKKDIAYKDKLSEVICDLTEEKIVIVHNEKGIQTEMESIKKRLANTKDGFQINKQEE